MSVIEDAASDPEPTNTALALAEAALAAFTSERLCGLLNDLQHVEATRTVSCYMATAQRAGPGSLGAPLAALHSLLTADRKGRGGAGAGPASKPALGFNPWAERQGGSSWDSWSVPCMMGLAVLSSGAAAPLLGVMEAGSKAGSSTDVLDAAEATCDDSLVALRCLRMCIVGCTQGGRPKGQAAVRAALTAAGLQRAVAVAVRYTSAGSRADSVLALDVLLAAVVCCGGEAVEAVVARVREEESGDGAAAYPLLTAVEALMESRDTKLTTESASALVQILSAMLAPGPVKAAEVLEEVPGEHTALAKAALAAFTSERLCGLLNDQQQVEAVRAVSCYMATAQTAGPGSLGAPLAALHSLLTADRSSCDSWSVPYNMGLAVVSSGAVGPLLGSMEAGSGAQGPNTGTGYKEDGDSLVALRCLGMSVVACMQGDRPKGQAAVRAALTAAGLQRAIAVALHFTRASSAEDSVLALDVLLAAVVCCGGEAVEAVVAGVREEQPGAGAPTLPLLAAVGALMESRDMRLTAESASALLQLLSAMYASGLVKAADLLQRLPSIRDAMLGVLQQQQPGSGWEAFTGIAVEQECGKLYTYPPDTDLAALRLLDQLIQQGLGGALGFGMELGGLAAALVRGVVRAKLPGNVVGYTMRLRSLVAVLQAMDESEAGLWYVDSRGSSSGKGSSSDSSSIGNGGSSAAVAPEPEDTSSGVSFG